MEASQSNTSRHQHLLLEFALTLLQRGLKKGALGGSSPKMLAMLDPLLPFLVTSLSSRHSLVVELSLRIFAQLVQLPLPGMDISGICLSRCAVTPLYIFIRIPGSNPINGLRIAFKLRWGFWAFRLAPVLLCTTMAKLLDLG